MEAFLVPLISFLPRATLLPFFKLLCLACLTAGTTPGDVPGSPGPTLNLSTALWEAGGD